MRKRIDALPGHFIGSPSSMGAEATLAAWRHGQPWLDEVKAQLRVNRDHLAARVESDLPGVTMHSPEATYLAWLDFTETAIAADPAATLLERGRVGLHAGWKFCKSASSFTRLNFASSPKILDEIIDRVATTLQETP